MLSMPVNEKYFVDPYENRLDAMVLMMGHKICFYGEIRLILPKFSLLSPLIWSTVILRQDLGNLI